MQERTPIGPLDRFFGVLEAAPVVVVQFLYRSVLGKSKRGRGSADYRADLVAWLRAGQRGECSPGGARDIFSLAAAHWALFAGLGLLVAMFLDYLFGVSFDVVIGISFTLFPSFALASSVDAFLARSERGRGVRGGVYTPVRNRWAMTFVSICVLASVWAIVL
ncbi:hypothetical protein ABZX85_09215 [Streptomyces sp. NPDC004539]|uniref:hypothetical protein n=1 Tax=Streptomyces sp. NPDC004539 TaxID=3154280 RepID=UPI0033AAE66F